MRVRSQLGLWLVDGLTYFLGRWLVEGLCNLKSDWFRDNVGERSVGTVHMFVCVLAWISACPCKYSSSRWSHLWLDIRIWNFARFCFNIQEGSSYSHRRGCMTVKVIYCRLLNGFGTVPTFQTSTVFWLPPHPSAACMQSGQGQRFWHSANIPMVLLMKKHSCPDKCFMINTKLSIC